MYPGLGANCAAPSQGSLARTALFFAVGFITVFGLYAVANANKTQMVPAPAIYKKFDAPDKSYVFDAPAGWQADTAGVPGVQASRAVFTKGQVAVTLKTDQSASALADIMNATNAQQQQFREDMQNQQGGMPPGMALPPPPVPAVEQLHKMDQADLTSKYQDYAEKPMHAFNAQTGDARLSEWTGVGDGGTHMHGYRVTLLTKDVRIRLICRCPEKNWKILQPAFVKMIHSVAPGQG